MTDKNKILTFPDTAAIDAEAAAWVARFDAGEVSAKDQAAFQEWLNRSALHRSAIAEYGNLWLEFDTLKQLTEGGETVQAPVTQVGHPRLLVRARPWFAACAAVAIAGVGGMAFFQPQPQTHPTRVATLATPENYASPRLFYESAVGAQKRVTLADGTSVILNTNSRLEVNFSANRRDIRLVRGEAYFDVVHDKTRPFTVYARDYVVRDIGTAFAVHLSKEGLVEVGVTKGSVEVTPARTAASGPVKSLGILEAGQNIVLGQKVEHVEAMVSADMGRKLAWRQGDLIYTGQPLKEVLADVSRYSDIKIELADPELENLPVGGAFRTDQIGAIFAALENNFGVHAEWIDPQHVRFTSSGEKSPAKN